MKSIFHRCRPAALALAAGLLVAPSLTSSAEAAFPGKNGRIAFVASENRAYADIEIYTMAPDGSDRTNISSNASWHDLAPAFSPDGQKVTFVRQPPRIFVPGDPEIYTMNVDGSGQTNITNHPANDGEPAFSRDGQRIAFRSYRDRNAEIYTMNVDGSGQTNITNHPADDAEPVFSPDGQRIAFRSYRDGNYEIYTMNLDGSGQTNITNHPANDAEPAFSPDGQRIAFRSYRDGNYEIYTMNLDGSGQTNITNHRLADTAPAFSPDGQRIAFMREGIHTMNVDGSDVSHLGNGGWPDWQPLPQPVDVTAPETSITSGPAQGSTTSDSTPTFDFSSSEAGSSFQCRVDAQAFGPCSSPYTTAALGDGQHTFEVRATDGAGNTDASPAARTFTVDTAPPETMIDSGPSGTVTDAAPTFAFSSSEPGSSFECRIDTAAFAACSSPLTTATLDEGAHTFEVRAIDPAQNTDPSPASRSFTVDLPARPPQDADGDGVPNESDLCPTIAGIPAAGGCPAPGATTPIVPAITAPSNVFSLIGKVLVRKRLTILTLAVPGPGIVQAAQADTPGARARASKPLVKPVRVTTGKAGKVTLRIRPSKPGRKRLRKKGSFSVELKVTYTPNGGEPRSTTKRVKIKR